MKLNYSISIPKPCHEDWNKMTSKDKGRFCQSCSKTVVDFTKMTTEEIQIYLHKNRHQRICGHIKQSQLDSINLRIPETIFNQHLSFHKVFLLALLCSMGMTLFSCEDDKGTSKKIESVEIIETHKKAIDTIIDEEATKKKTIDSSTKKRIPIPKKPVIETPQIIDGLIIMGDIEETPIDVDIIDIDSLDIEKPTECNIIKNDTIEVPEIMGGIISPPDDNIVGFMVVEQPPEFKNTPQSLSSSEKKKHLSDRISKMVKENFNKSLAKDNGLKGKQKIYTQFKINKKGLVTYIKVRTTHPALEKEAIRVLNLLPQFTPARQRGKPIEVVYTLPIVFMVEDL